MLLVSIKMYRRYQFIQDLEKGFELLYQYFLKQDGTPKYYHNKTYPIDIHCPAQLFVTASKLNNLNHQDFALK